jgi:hypothetical protein
VSYWTEDTDSLRYSDEDMQTYCEGLCRFNTPFTMHFDGTGQLIEVSHIDPMNVNSTMTFKRQD